MAELGDSGHTFVWVNVYRHPRVSRVFYGNPHKTKAEAEVAAKQEFEMERDTKLVETKRMRRDTAEMHRKMRSHG